MSYRYTGLARVARDAGLKVTEGYNWSNRGVEMGTVQSIMIHHTAAKAYTKNTPSLSVVQNGRPGIPGPLCNYLIGRDGTVVTIAAGRAHHAGTVAKTMYSNSHSIGIEIENDGVGEAYTDELMEAVVKLTAALVKEFKLDVSAVVGHKEAAVPRGRKIDPTFSMDTFRAAVKRGYWKASDGSKGKGGTSTPGEVDTASNKPSSNAAWPVTSLRVNNRHTKATHAAWVKLLADVGYKDKDLTVNFQEWLKDLGYYEGKVDGDFGPMTTEALQSFLKKKGFYKGLIDGDRGSHTIRAEISYLNSQRDHYKK